MSTDADKDPACPNVSGNSARDGELVGRSEGTPEKKKHKGPRKVSFPPDEDQLVTQYFEPANPWQDVPATTREQLAAEYLDSCRRHGTEPIASVLQQIQELPENAIGGSVRAPRLLLSQCLLLGAAAVDALEAVLRKTQFRRIEIDHSAIDDEGAEALFDMIEYYESATMVSIKGPRDFAIRGWQAASRMIKKSAELQELQVVGSPVGAMSLPALSRALRPHSCRLRALSLTRTQLCGEPLRGLLIALKSNSSIRELRLGDNGLDPSDAVQIASLLRMNTRVQLLDLSNNQIMDQGLAHIADALADQTSQTPPPEPLSPHHCGAVGFEGRGLAFLVLWNNQLTRNCAHHLGRAVRMSNSLCMLNIGRNAIGTAGVAALCDGGGGALASLGLQGARLGPESAAILPKLLQTHALQVRNISAVV
ncbi:unnamed protein product [Plutella xylostella]|uniref:(diamondback moth) hypothetical protein n=1 Tax=Plutella xylostella TaxID=51655 RepID=A0A8S4EZR9_PLUXY|nr:unnamed protein product [Plutella xylostella]